MLTETYRRADEAEFRAGAFGGINFKFVIYYPFGTGGENKAMSDGIVQVYYGTGTGKSSAAVGQCIRLASRGLSAIIIQFLKGKDSEEFSCIERLEPEIKLFRFEREFDSYDELPASKKKEEKQNILNGFNFAKKVIKSGECDVLVLDEVLGLVDLDIVTVDDIREIINIGDYKRLILTGTKMPPELDQDADVISRIELEKDDTV